MKSAKCWMGLAFAAGLLLGAPVASAWFSTCYTETVDGIPWTYYCISDGQAVIGNEWSSYSYSTSIPTETSGAITIPSSLGYWYPVTEIGNYAFCGCHRLTSVTIPEGVTSIGAAAFSNCWYLTSVKIPSSVTYIGGRAFSGCWDITSVTIPSCVCKDRLSGVFTNSYRSISEVTICEGVTNIGNYAFSGCSSLASVTIPDSVTSIGQEAFEDCSSLAKVTILGNVTNDYWSSRRPFLNCTNLSTLVLGGKMTKIGSNMFYHCSSLTNVTLGNGIKSIGGYAFAYCSNLPSMTIPPSVRSIGDNAFYQCTGLTRVTMDNGVTNIGDSAFSYCTNLTSVTIPSSVTSIGDNAFSGCSGLTSVTIPSSVTNIGDYAFYGCDNLTSVTIPSSVTSIGNYAFSYCRSLTSVTIPASVKNIGEYAFCGCKGLTRVAIGNGVTNIGDYAFCGCTDLTSVTIPDSVKNIGTRAFEDCSGLLTTTIGNSVTNIGKEAFAECWNLRTLDIPDSVKSIGSNAFELCKGLVSCTIGKGMESIARGKADYDYYDNYYECSAVFAYAYTLTAFSVHPENKHFKSVNGVLYTKDGKELVAFPAGCSGEFAIPNGVEKIWVSAFCGAFDLKLLIVPDSVTEIGDGAFHGCSSLRDVYLPARFKGNKLAFFGVDRSSQCSHCTFHYERPVERTLTLDGNGGSVETVTIRPTYCESMPAVSVPTRKGYRFGGYFSEPDGGGVQYYTSDGKSCRTWDSLSVTTLYAKWVTNHSVAFDANGGSCKTAAKTYAFGKPYGSLPAASRNGYAFLGWFTQASGGTRVTAQTVVPETESQTLYAHWEKAEEPLKVWRFYSEKTKGHFFTIGEAEKTQLLTTSLTWTFQGGAYRAYKAKASGTVPLYRFYSEKYQGHFFTVSEAEKNNLVATSKTWKYQGIAFYVYPKAADGRIPVYRFWSDSYGHHFYTASEAEKNNLIATSKTWKYQGIAFWAEPLTPVVPAKATVKFNANGGSCGTASKTYASGKAYGELPAATRNGQAFLGWFTAASGGTRVTAQSTVTGTATRTLYAHWEAAEEPLKVWRFYSEKNKGHFFTISEAEKTQLLTTSPTWSFQGGAYRAYKTKVEGTVPLYRFYSESYKGHFFTRSEAEKNNLVATSKTWKYEGIAYYVYSSAASGRIPVYRFWSDSYRHHFYTANEAEKNSLVATSKTWKYQGIAFWALPVDYKSGSRTLTVHDKDKPNWSVPVAGYYCDSYQKCEMVYPAAELGAMKGTTITGMTFYAAQTNMTWGGKCRVFLKEVGGKTISTFSGSGTVVYEGTLRIANNKLVVSFSTPYAYKGGNLLVGVYRTVKGSGGVSSKWLGEQVTGASISGYNSSSLSSVTPTQRDFLPRTTFAYAVGTAKAAATVSAGAMARGGALRPDPQEVLAATEGDGMTGVGEEDVRLSPVRLDAEVTTSDGTDGSAAADGDAGTAWTPERPEAGSWLVLTFAGPIEVAEVTVAGENLPEDTRVLLSEDAETWYEGEGGPAQYVWVAFPPVAEVLKVREVWVAKEGE